MKTAEEMKEQYTTLYDYMAASREPKNMKAFGRVMTEMMEWLVANKPEVAEEMIQKLEAIRWRQYLTRKEAENIVARMKPDAPWKHDVWLSAMEKLSIPTEEQPYYNGCALWCEMNKQYSDHGETLAEKVWKKPLSTIPSEDIVPVMHSLATDLLKDRDDRYDIRAYFGL
jgi:hypothetical protein